MNLFDEKNFKAPAHFNKLKREIIRDLKKYSLASVIKNTRLVIADDDFKIKWIAYLILKWKFIVTDPSRSVNSGRECTTKIIYNWSGLLWDSKASIMNVHIMIRQMIGVQSIWYGKSFDSALFMPTFIMLLDEDDPIRKHIKNEYEMDVQDFALLASFIFLFHGNFGTVISAAAIHSENMNIQVKKIFDKLSFNYKLIIGQGLHQTLSYEDAVIKFLSEIDINSSSKEYTEIPWIQQYPIVIFENESFLLIDKFLWEHRASNYFYEQLFKSSKFLQNSIGQSFEKFCKKIIVPYFTDFKPRVNLPKSQPNADMLAEDSNYFYIFEFKHKKYDKDFFNANSTKDLSNLVENQVLSGYKQVKATAYNIDNRLGIFEFARKHINKKRIGFIVTESDYKVASGRELNKYIEHENLLTNDHLDDKDIYIISIFNLEMCLLASKENNTSLASVVSTSFDSYKSFDKRKLRSEFPTTDQTQSALLMQKLQKRVNDLANSLK